jgi:nitrogenase molybdenum-iron protein alpha/beta subunit
VKINVRIAAFAAALSLYGAATAGAQQDEHKPGGLNKVAHDVSNTAKKAGRDTKAEVHRDASKTHNALTDAGNETKTTLKKTTGIKGSQSHQPGGLNKVARNISNTSKKAGSDAKGELKQAKGAAHGASTEAGKSIKDTVLKKNP